jgi:hypothetical protein
MKISEIRQKFPQYADLPDEQLVIGLHKKFYSDIPFKEFGENIEYTATDPTEGMSTAGKFAAGMGQGAARRGRAIGQGLGMYSDAEIAEANRLDGPLLNTTSGKVGSFAGSVAALAPTMLIPGANTYAGATAIGALTGAATTEGGLKERAAGAALGAAGGAAGKFLGDQVGAGLNRLADRSQASALLRQSQNASKDATLAAGREAGYVVPPSNVEGSSTAARIAEGLGGKIKTQQSASLNNEKVTTNLARKALGLADDAPVTRETLNQVRDTAYKAGYEPVRSAGQIAADADFTKVLGDLAQKYGGASKSFPGAAKNDVAQALEGLKVKAFDAGDAVDMIKMLRADADGAFRAGNSNLGKAQKGAADALESQLERALAAAGDDGAGMLKSYRDARQLMAKTYSVEKALNDATGSVSGAKLAAQLSKGKPLSDEMKTAAKFAQSYPASNQANVNVAPYSVLDMFGAGVGIGTNPLVAAGIAARPLARAAVLSQAGQRFAQPSYGGNALLSRLGGAAESTPANMLFRTTPIGLVPANQ